MTKTMYFLCHHEKGGYTNEDKILIESVCSPSQSVMIQRLIKQIDPKVFVKIILIVSVWGRGNRFIDINVED